MIRLDKGQILYLHQIMLDETGGLLGVRDDNLLESAIEAPFQTFNGIDLYPALLDKAARLCYGLIQNHVFIDGNKRIGIYAMLVFLDLNGLYIKCGDDDLVRLGLAVADGQYDSLAIKSWLEEHLD